MKHHDDENRETVTLTPEELAREVEAKAKDLFQAKVNRDKEIDDIVLAVRKRDKKDFGELAATAKQEDWSVDKFRAELLKRMTPFELHLHGAESGGFTVSDREG